MPPFKFVPFIPTVDCECGGLALPPGGDVLRDAGVVGRVRDLGVHDDQVSLARDQEVLVLGPWLERAPVLGPGHGGRGLALGRVAPHLHLAPGRDLLGVGWNLELPLQVWKKS